MGITDNVSVLEPAMDRLAKLVLTPATPTHVRTKAPAITEYVPAQRDAQDNIVNNLIHQLYVRHLRFPTLITLDVTEGMFTCPQHDVAVILADLVIRWCQILTMAMTDSCLLLRVMMVGSLVQRVKLVEGFI